jgi:tetratricopeptide (TPR) repeat protein
VATICLAEAHRAAGDLKAAHQQLDELLRQEPDDVNVLDRLANLAATQKDKKRVIHYRKQIAELTDQPTAWQRLLAAYEQAAGNEEEIISIARRLVIEHDDVECLPALVDRNRMRNSKLAERYVRAGLRVSPTDWRLTYRAALLTPSNAEAIDFYERTLRLCLGDPDLLTSAEQKSHLPKAGAVTPKSTYRIQTVPGQYGTSRVAVRPSDDTMLNQNLPAFAELKRYSYTYGQLRQWKIAQSKSSGENRIRVLQSSGRTSRSRTNRQRVISNDAFETAVDSVLALALESLATADSLIEQSLAAGNQAEWIGLRIQLMKHVATNDIWQHIDMLDRFAELRPADPLPHLAQFYSPCSAHNEVEKKRAAASLSRSFDWVAEHDRKLADHLTRTYAQQLVYIGRHEDAAELISQQLEQIETIIALREIALLSLQVQVPEFRRRFLSRALELAENPGTIPEDFGAVLVVALADASPGYDSDDWKLLFALIDRYLGGPPNNARSRTVTSLSTYRQRYPSFDRMLIVRNAYLSSDQRAVLYYALNHARRDGLAEPFVQWMRDQASDADASITRQVALGFILWRARQRTEALSVFEKLVDLHPHDADLRLNAATAALECNELQRCFMLLSHRESLDGSRVESDVLELAARLNAAIVKSLDYDVVLGCVVAALEHQTIPQLSVFFRERTEVVAPNVYNSLPATPASDRNEIAVSVERPLSRNPHTTALILSVLDHAWQLDNDRIDPDTAEPVGPRWLDRIQTATQSHLAIFPRNVELRVLDALIHMRRSEFDEAQAVVRQWQPTTRAFRWTDSSVRVLALTVLNEGATQPTADLLASRFIIESVTQGAAQRAGQLLSVFTHSIAEQQGGERTEQFWQTFFTTLADSMPPPNNDTTRFTAEIDPVSDVVELFSEIPANAVPDAIHYLAEFMAKHASASNQRNRIGRALQIAIHKANFSWADNERSRALDGVTSLMFSRGPNAPAVLYLWNDSPERGVVVQRRSLAEAVIRLASELGVLDELRATWDKHALANSPSLLALRTEAAAAANDENAANDLIRQIIELRTSDGLLTPVWTREILAQVDSDRAIADWALRSGGQVWLRFSSSNSTDVHISQRKQMPIDPFQVTRIAVGSSYKDPGLTRLTPRLSVDDVDAIANLPRLVELVLFNTSISDEGLVKLANLQQLETLRLDGSAITDEGLVHLHGLKKLKHLTLTKTTVTDAGIAALRRALPGCKIVSPNGEGTAP